MRSEMDEVHIEKVFRCCALGTRKRLLVFSVRPTCRVRVAIHGVVKRGAPSQV